MAIDTELKRKSIAGVGNVAMPISLVPNASPGNPERQAIGWSYSGIAAAGAVVGQPFYIRDSYTMPDFLGNQQG